jgi:hypothetical protein
MDAPSRSLALLNVYEVVTDGVRRHLVCFLDPILAGSRGIDPRSVIGEFTPGQSRGFDRASFNLNPAFIEAFRSFMNEQPALTPELVEQALNHASGWLYVLDPRFRGPSGTEPGAADLLGCYAVDGTGQIVPNSFIYNENHVWFDPASGVSGVLSDRRFYDWLHPAPGPGP